MSDSLPGSLLTVVPDPAARVRLVCFPHAGAGASLFARWKGLLPSTIQLCSVHLPGRETRLSEPPDSQIEPLVEDLRRSLTSFADRPIALFGYSMGALLAFEVARALRRTGIPPVALFVAALRAPQIPSQRMRISGLPEPEFLAALIQRYGGIPREILNEPELLRLFIPILRTDLALIEEYRYDPGPPLQCPIRCFGGTEDASVTRAELEMWREQTLGNFDLQMMSGGHFFIKPQAAALTAAVIQTC